MYDFIGYLLIRRRLGLEEKGDLEGHLPLGSNSLRPCPPSARIGRSSRFHGGSAFLRLVESMGSRTGEGRRAISEEEGDAREPGSPSPRRNSRSPGWAEAQAGDSPRLHSISCIFPEAYSEEGRLLGSLLQRFGRQFLSTYGLTVLRIKPRGIRREEERKFTTFRGVWFSFSLP